MASYGLTLVTAPTAEPIYIGEAKRQCVDVADGINYHDEKIASLVTAAREKVETDTGRALMPQTWDYTFDLFPCSLQPIYLPKNPVASITHIKYYDTSNVQQTLATSVYKTMLDREPAEIRLKSQQQWPFLYGEPGVCVVRMVCGYTSALTVPASLKQAIKLLLKAYFDGEPVNEDTYEALIAKWQTGDEFHSYGRSLSYA